MSSQPPKKQRAVGGSRTPQATSSVPMVELEPERRKQMMASMNIVETAPENIEPEWTMDGIEYSEEEDLLNIKVPDKYKDLATDPGGSRLIIQDIFVDNFKSYKGWHQLGPFHKNLTMILGPNGSGKSNVIDALLFVFGFRGNKIRTRKLTALIHSSDHSDACDYCKVEIHFQIIKDVDEEKYTVTPHSSFRIARSVHRDGLTQYKINKNVATQKEVTDLLLRAGIDMTHNRFLILQGEVEAIALMKPTSKNAGEEGMLEYIEDIVGTNRFVVPIAKLAHRVALLEIKASQFTAAIRRHEYQVTQFEPQMEAAVAYINAQNHLTYLHGVNLKNSVAKLQASVTAMRESIGNRRDELERLDEEKKEADLKLKKAEKRENKCQESLQELMNQKNTREGEVTDWHAKDARRKANVKAAAKELVVLNKELENAQKELELAKAAPQKAIEGQVHIVKEIRNLVIYEEKCKKMIDTSLLKFEQRTMKERKDRERLSAEYATHNENLIRVQSELAIVESEVRDMRVTAGQDERRLAELRNALGESEERQNGEKAELDRVTSELETVTKKLDAAQSQLPALMSAERDLRSRKTKLQDEINDINHAREQTLYRHHATLPLTRLKEKGGFPGYIGRLGDLGRIDRRYDAAVSTIVPQLDYQIVQTLNDASFAIDWCYKNRVNRTTFFNIDYIEKFDLCGMNSSPNKFPATRLYDQVQCDDEKLRAVFYFFFGDMLVVDTLTEATKLDKKYKGRFRVCTIEGAIIDRLGAVTGGGKPLTNRMRTDNGSRAPIIDKANVLKQMQVKMNRIQNDHKSIEQRLNEQQEIVRSCSPTVRMLQEQQAELRANLPVQARRIKSLRDAIAEQEAKAPQQEVTEEEIEAKRQLMDDLNRKLVDARKLSEEAREQLDESQRKIDKIFKKMVTSEKDKLTETRLRIERCEFLMARDKATIDNGPQHIEAATKKEKELQQQVLEKRLEADALGSLESECDTKELRDLQLAIKELQSDIAICEEKVRESGTQRQEAEAKERTAAEQYQQYKSCFEEVLSMLDGLECSLDRDTRDMEALDDEWLEPETLDPHVKIVRMDQEDALEEVANGALLMPPEVLEKIERHKEKYEETPVAMLDANEIPKITDQIIHLEKTVERFRQLFDEKGISHYATLKTLHSNEESDYNKYTEKVASHRKKLNELRVQRLDEFSEALAFLGTTTQMLYQLITNGGDASLKFVEEGKSSDPFDAGIKFSVRPAKKSWKLIENLSGGEKTLASLCFVFAMHHYRATPLYVMDEIDAALDLNNVRLIANYIKHSERTRNAQFIIISLRNQMFEVGNRLIGIYKVHGCTHNIVIAPEQVENGNKSLQETLMQKIKEEERKRKEEANAQVEKMLTDGMSNVTIAKRRRKLGKIVLAEFGLDNDDEENEDPSEPRSSVCRELSEEAGPSTSSAHYRHSSRPAPDSEPNPFDDDDDDDEPVRRRRRRQVEEEEEEEEEEEVESTPTPPPPPATKAKARRSRRI